MKNVYTVAQVNAYIKNLFTQDYFLRSIMVRGEVSNLKYHSSGHIYFTLKDEKGTLSCIMFAGNRRGLNFLMKEGDQVIISGSVDVYERDGRCQLYCVQILKDGAGVLSERYEQLKRKLQEQGMFEEAYKRPIPQYIRTLGVVTAPNGAAVQDILSISLRRNPYLQIILYPAIVQGAAAAASIVNGIHALEDKGCDTIIIGRGGGSLEDLWAFNEEIVAEAVFNCPIPIISAVGHETDTVISDYVADLRAATPSAAAELAVFLFDQWESDVNHYQQRLTDRMDQAILSKREQLTLFEKELSFRSPNAKIRDCRMFVIHAEELLSRAMERHLVKTKTKLSLQAAALEAQSPLRKLSGGFDYVTNAQGKAVRSIQDVKKKDSLAIYVKDGKIAVSVDDVEEQWRSK